MRQNEQGVVLVTLIMVLLPLVLVAGAFTAAMVSRSNELRLILDRERALLAAESGVDDAIFRGQIGTLSTGGSYGRSLGAGMSFAVVPTHLGSDGLDNDVDGQVDEADEDVYQVIVTGHYRTTRRRVAAYLGPVPLLPSIEYALGVTNPAVAITVQGAAEVSGNAVNMNGTPAGVPAVPGMAITPPGTLAQLNAELTGGEPNRVVGAGGTPSIGTTAAVNVISLAAQIQNVANLVLTSSHYAAYDFGNGPAGIANITYRSGDVMFSGNSQGAGILVVTGDLEIIGTFRFDGVVIVLGDFINSAGTALINGAVLQGPAGAAIELNGNLQLNYSPEAIALANSISGSYVAFNGWQEIER